MAENKKILLSVEVKGNDKLNQLQANFDANTRELKKLRKQQREGTGDTRKLNEQIARSSTNLIGNRNALNDQRAALLKNNNALRKNSGFVAGVRKGVGQWATSMIGVTVAIAAVTKLVGSSIKTIKEYDESISNLQKVTGLAKKEAKELAKEILKLDTRTSVTALLELATAGGRLGLQGQELIDFTQQTDRAFVSLGDSLEGSAEEIGLSLGKIAANFGIEEQFGIGEAINKIGSSLNELGANSKASEGAIQDFTNRLSGVGSQAGLTVPEVQALGALFSESGQSIEVASSTFNKLLPAMGADVEGFAKVAGVNIDEFSVLVRDKPFEALKAVAEGAKSSEKGLVGLSSTLKNYGINNARAAGIVTLLSDKTDRLTELQELANGAFEEGTSLSNEFAIKNETLTAKTERLTNQWDKFIISLDGTESAIGGALGGITKFFSDALTGLENLDLIWKSTFGGLADFTDKEISRTLDGAWATETGVNISKITEAFDKIPIEKIKGNAEEVQKAWIDAVGEDPQDAMKLFNGYVKQRIIEENKLTQALKEKKKVEEGGEGGEGGGTELTKEQLAAIEREKKKQEKISADRISLQAKLQNQLDAIEIAAIEDDRVRKEVELLNAFERKIEAITGDSEIEKELKLRLAEELRDALNEQQEVFAQEDAEAEAEQLQIKKELDLEIGTVETQEELEAKKKSLEDTRAAIIADQTLTNKEKLDLLKKLDAEIRANETALAEFKKDTAAGVAQQAANLAGALSSLAKEGSEEAKGFAIVQAGINGALAITQALAQLGPIAGAIAAVGIGITTGVQIAKISGAEFEDGGVLQGASHANGGIPFTIGGQAGFEAEGGEAIINKRSTAMFGDLLSDINQAGGGVAFARGGLARKFQSGGALASSTGVTAGQQRGSIETGMERFAEDIISGINDKEVINVSTNTSTVANEVNNIAQSANF